MFIEVEVINLSIININDKKEVMQIEGTCWLVSFINYMYLNQKRKLSFFNCLGINRILRYNALIRAINNESIKEHPELFETMLSFEGSFFDIISLITSNCDFIEKKEFDANKIYLSNESIKFKLAYLINHVEDYNQVINEINEILDMTYGFHTIKKEPKEKLQIISYDPILKNKQNYKLTNNVVYENDLSFYNYTDSYDLIKIIDSRIKNKKATLISFDLNKGFLKDRMLKLINNVNYDVYNKYFDICNHCLLITGKVVIDNTIYYKVQDVYKIQSYDYIEQDYLIKFLNQIVIEDTIDDKYLFIDTIDYLKGDNYGNSQEQSDI